MVSVDPNPVVLEKEQLVNVEQRWIAAGEKRGIRKASVAVLQRW